MHWAVLLLPLLSPQRLRLCGAPIAGEHSSPLQEEDRWCGCRGDLGSPAGEVPQSCGGGGRAQLAPTGGRSMVRCRGDLGSPAGEVSQLCGGWRASAARPYNLQIRPPLLFSGIRVSLFQMVKGILAALQHQQVEGNGVFFCPADQLLK